MSLTKNYIAMKTLLRTLALVLIVVISASSASFAVTSGSGKGPQKYNHKKRMSNETAFYSKESKQSKYKKCPKFRKAK